MFTALREAASSHDIPRWTLKGQVCAGVAVSIYDGDTFDAVITIPSEGDAIKRLTIRMLGYNSPEMKAMRSLSEDERSKQHASAIEARNKLWSLIGGEEKAILRIECYDWDKYGRLLARVYKLNSTAKDLEDVGECVNDTMLALPSSDPMML